ncbi:hypothetical protein GALMADRAFT_78564 [Galerina marginata CBS 339.88]|uniref:Integral membrane protein n=1 Tax=Galerina marginata (strain CBS 339.88) TaxID=685588 RepID=A0A067SBY2_GALM3|nr:hypothetical protein GALMADRAFT_78564 [Galerina marginata CBS 339.88]
MDSDSNDPETLTKLHSRFVKHEDHYDISRWHLVLHPSIVKECARNSLPKSIGQFFHPTQAVFAGEGGRKQAWSSRSNRKHRYDHETSPGRHLRSFWHGVANMRHLEYWNISWWVAAFTVGSIVWVINGFAAFLPFCNSHFMKAMESPGWTAFLGATIFEIGSIFGILEVWNTNQTASFGQNVGQALKPKARQDTNETKHNSEKTAEEGSPTDTPSSEQDNAAPKQPWIWFSTDPKFFHEIGFLAAFFQLLAASIFWISGFTAIPTIQNALMNNKGLNDGIFWTPQVIGGTGFMISATFIMLEAQDVWWKPKITSLGWQVGVWNFVGAVGFALSGAFGYAGTNHAAEYQSALSTFWGGWGFLIGSVIQWYECVNGS